MELLERDRIDFVFDRRQRVTCDTRRVGRLEMTFRIPSRLCGEDKPVRYWFDRVDEGFERGSRTSAEVRTASTNFRPSCHKSTRMVSRSRRDFSLVVPGCRLSHLVLEHCSRAIHTPYPRSV